MSAHSAVNPRASIHPPISNPAHSYHYYPYLIQIKMPKFQLAHLGSLLRLQSAQTRFPGSFRSDLMIAWLAAALSAAGFGRRDIAAVVGLMTIAFRGCASFSGKRKVLTELYGGWLDMRVWFERGYQKEVAACFRWWWRGCLLAVKAPIQTRSIAMTT